MNKKTLIKLLAFVTGLYFVLEFLLPEKIGGDFDQYEVLSPAAARRPDGACQVWYVGVHRRSQSAVGLVEVDAAGAESVKQREPVLRRSLFRESDQRGFAALSAVPTAEQLILFYLGRKPDDATVLCRATSPDGRQWTKCGPVNLLCGAPGALPTAAPADQWALTALAAAPQDDGLTVFLARRVAGGLNAVLRGRSTDGQTWLLDSTPLELDGFAVTTETQALAAIADGADLLLWVRQNGGPLRLYRVAPDGRTTTLGTTDLPATAASLSVVRVGDGYRAWLGMVRPLLTAPTPESSRQRTWLAQAVSGDGLHWILERDADRPVAALGRMGRPTYLSRALPRASQALEVIQAFALGLAVVNLVVLHGKKIAKREGNPLNSLMFFVAFSAMFTFTYLGQCEGLPGIWKSGYDFMFDDLQRSMGSAVFSMIGFFMVSAAYRSFRVRSVEAGIMMLAAIIVMLGAVPLGQLMTSWAPEPLQLPALANKLLNVVNAAAEPAGR